jgi:hypothetical protein
MGCGGTISISIKEALGMEGSGERKKHYSDEEWADLARQVGSQEQMEAMQSHLKQCRKCEKVFSMWQRVNEIAHRRQAAEPSETVVRTVKGMYALHGMKARRPMESLVAELLFDSLQGPLQVGVRSSGTAARQLLFGSGEYRIDLRIEPKMDSEKVALVGQVLNAANPDKTVDSAPVALVRGGKVLAKSLTNNLGEFQLEYDLEPHYELRVTLPGNAQMIVPLVEPAAGGTTERPQVAVLSGFMNAPQGSKKSTRKKE